MNVISVRKSNLSDVCRVCLSSTNAPFTDIFSARQSNLSATIAAAVMECAPVHIVQGDGLPTLICNSCNNNLEISHQFRTLCVRSESILQRYVAQHINTSATNNIENSEAQTTFVTESVEEQKITNGGEQIAEKETNCSDQQQQMETATIYIKQENEDNVQQQQQQQQQQLQNAQVQQQQQHQLQNAQVQQQQNYHDKPTSENSIIKEITTAQIISKPQNYSETNEATVLKHEIITEVDSTKLNTDGNCYQIQGAIESTCFSTDQTQEIQYRFFNPIIGNTDGQIIKVNNIDKTNATINNSNNTIPEQNFESYLVKLFTKEEERPHKCNVCLKTFKRSSNLSEHAKVHSECRPYKCEICQKWFKRSCDLAEHKRSHSNERPFKCTVCPKSFKRNCDLSEHMKIHTNERPFECDICHKGFKRNGQYLEHRRIHTGERPYECEVCHQHFRTSSKLSAHSRIHNEERNHKCSLCPKSFRSYKSLTIHSRVHLDQ